MARYRWPTVIVAASGAVLAGFALWWIFLSYTDYRSKDYTKVSEGPVTGTCIEAVSTDQLKWSWYDEDGWSCNTNSKDALQVLLGASVHALYDQHTNGADYTGDAKAAYDAVISATQGTDSGYKITRQVAYDMLAAIGTPSIEDCATLYSVSAEVAAPAPVDVAVVCDADVPTTNTAPTGVTADTQSLRPLRDAILLSALVPEVGLDGHPRRRRGGQALPAAARGRQLDDVVAGPRARHRRHPLGVLDGVLHVGDAGERLLPHGLDHPAPRGVDPGTHRSLKPAALQTPPLRNNSDPTPPPAPASQVDAYFSQNAIVEGNRNAMKEGVRAATPSLAPSPRMHQSESGSESSSSEAGPSMLEDDGPATSLWERHL